MALYGHESGGFSEHLVAAPVPMGAGTFAESSIAHCRTSAEYAGTPSNVFRVIANLRGFTGIPAYPRCIANNGALFLHKFQPPYGTATVPIDYTGTIANNATGGIFRNYVAQEDVVSRGGNNFIDLGPTGVDPNGNWFYAAPGFSADIAQNVAYLPCLPGHYNTTILYRYVSFSGGGSAPPIAAGDVQLMVQAVDENFARDITPGTFHPPTGALNFSFDSVAVFGRITYFVPIMRCNKWPDFTPGAFLDLFEMQWTGSIGP